MSVVSHELEKEKIFKIERGDGSEYEGPLDEEERPHGHGVEKKDSGKYEYKGEWNHGIKEGHGGEKDERRGEVYNGTFKGGLRNGQGALVRGDGYSYEGEWLDNMP